MTSSAAGRGGAGSFGSAQTQKVFWYWRLAPGRTILTDLLSAAARSVEALATLARILHSFGQMARSHSKLQPFRIRSFLARVAP
jgi:hypothetical protein